MKSWVGAALLIVLSASASAVDIEDDDVVAGPAPAGDPKMVAAKAIADGTQPCPKIVEAQRLTDGSIKAYCSNAEDYRVLMLDGLPTAMRCSALRKANIRGC